ncbi:MAG: hypothetical protein LBT60_06605, partial [Oscillospiraceae bacterium]|nr:hypothetical protein [Oscillospiraceae bacterium]
MEQCQLVFFPEERPVFSDVRPTPPDSFALSRLSAGPGGAVATAAIYYRGQLYRGRANAVLPSGAAG